MVEYNASLMDRLLTESPSKEYFERNYPDAMKRYKLIRKNFGLTCTTVLYHLKYIWLEEEKKRGKKFHESIETGVWDG